MTDRQEGPLWGEAAERQQREERARLLEKLPEALRPQGEELLAQCEQDFAAWSYTVALMTLAGAQRLKNDEARLDLLKETLKFYRLAVLADWLEEASKASEKELLEFPKTFKYSYHSCMQKVQASVARLRLLSEGLEEVSDAQQ